MARDRHLRALTASAYMAVMDRADRYSRLVLWLKVALPLLALAILSTLFFVAETLDPEAAIPYADVDVEQALQDQGMTRPTFGGVTPEGVEIQLTALEVRPDPELRSRLNGHDLKADLKIPQQGTIAIRSPEGLVDADTGIAALRGGALLESSTGFTVATEQITASFKEATARADSEVRATGPVGMLTAGAMELMRQHDDNASYLLVFKNGVRLIYEPKP